MSRTVHSAWIVRRHNGEIVEVFSSWIKANAEYSNKDLYVIEQWKMK